MDDDILQRFAAASRVSLRAVLAEDQEDARDALTRAGIFDAVAVPAFVGEDAGLPGGILGSGSTANLTGTLELDEADGFGDLGAGDAGGGGGPDAGANPAATVTLPEAFGQRPMAPVRQAGLTRTMAPPAVRKPSPDRAQAGPGMPARPPDGTAAPDDRSPPAS